MLNFQQLEAVARMFGVLSEPTRLAILQFLKKETCSVNDLVEKLDAKQANISKQLGILYDAGLVERQRTGLQVFYSIKEPMIFQLCELVCGKLKRDAQDQLKAFANS